MAFDTFTDAQGHVFLDGRNESRLRVVGWLHVLGCPRHRIAIGQPAITVEVGVNDCDCGGKVLIGWDEEWPLPPREPSQSVVVGPGYAP